MKPTTLVLMTGAIALFTGCTDGTKPECDSADTAACDTSSGTTPYEGDTYLDSFGWDCDDTDYWYDIYTVGWTGGGWLDIYETGSDNPWEEGHPMGSYDYDPDGYWDNLYLELDILVEGYGGCSRVVGASNPCYEAQEAGSTTLYLCDSDFYDQMTWAVRVYDADTGTSELDCVAWGDDPTFYSSCSNGNTWR